MCEELNHENGCRRFHHGPMATASVESLPSYVAELESVGCLLHTFRQTIIPIVDKHDGRYSIPLTQSGWEYQGTPVYEASEEFVEALSAPDREVFDAVLSQNLNTRYPYFEPRKFPNY
jgi:hypothetical protein